MDLDYKIIESIKSVEILVDNVNIEIKKGYIPQGGVFCATGNYNNYLQAMYKPKSISSTNLQSGGKYKKTKKNINRINNIKEI